MNTRRSTSPSPRRRLRAGLGLGAALLALALVACGGGGGEPVSGASPGPSAGGAGGPGSAQAVLAGLPRQPLSDAEAASLAFMREEEQLAHDVYAQSALRWPQQAVFANIADSEAQHTASVKSLLDRYALVDAMAGLPGGRFSRPDFQALHDDLVALSSRSLVDALRVGLQIEELDIRDIEAQMLAIDNEDILLVYERLLRGSRNHLRAYHRVLAQQGGVYAPQFIGQAQFDAIVAAPMETGP